MVEEKHISGNESPFPHNRNMETFSPGTASVFARLTGAQEFVKNWAELRLMGKQPDRRSYHSSFIYDKKLYVYGGLDI